MPIELLDPTDVSPGSLDRRRAGRPDSVNPKLLPLLRAEERARLPPLVEGSVDRVEQRRLDAGQALVLATGVGALLWGLLIAAGWALFGI